MVIVAGHITVEPQQRNSYLAGCVRIVEQARRAVGCLDVAICADLVDPGRVNIFERWESQAALETFRSSGPDTEQRPAMLTVSVQEYDIADVRPVFGKAANLDSVSILPAVVRRLGVQVDHTTRGRQTCSTEPRSTNEIRASVRS
jgi:quinol monooxygenase YgiN